MKRNIAHVGHALSQLFSEKFAAVNGAAAATNIAVTGITTSDHIVGALYFPITGGNVTGVVDITSEVSIFSAGNIRVSTTVTTGGRIVLLWSNYEARP